MNNIVDVEVPASIKMVKLELKDRTPQLTLRSILPTIRRLIDAGLFFGQDEGEIRELKRKYGL